MKLARVGLALILTLEAAPLRASASDHGPDDLGRAFSNLKQFAAEAETPAAAPVVAVPLPAPVVSVDGHLEIRAPVRWDGSWKNIIGKHEREFIDVIAELTTGLDGNRYDVDVTISYDMFPSIKVLRVERKGRPQLHLWINSGAFAFVENRDEFAALVAQALAREAPDVLVHRDDPRVMRRIEEQVAFESLPKAARRGVLADVSAIERLRALGLRPWALTDLEKRVMTRYRKQWEERFKRARQFRSTVDGAGDDILFNSDELYEVRLLAQKIAVTYLQERENIRDLIKSSHDFSPGWQEIRANAFGLYRDTLHPRRALARFIGVPLLVFSAVVTFFIYVPVFPWLGSIAKSIGDTHAARLMGGVITELLKLQGHAWAVEAGWLGTKLVTIVTALVHGAVAVGNFAMLVLGPVGSAIVGILTPIWHAFIGALIAGYDLSAWLVNTLWIYIVVPAVGLGFFYYFARSTVEAFIEARRTDSFIFHRWTLGQLNRWRRPNFVEERLRDPSAGPTDLERIFRVADDLRRVWTDGASLPFSEAIKFQPQTLRVLADGYQAPEDLWTFLKAFLAQVTMRIEDGRLQAADLRRVFDLLCPTPPYESFAQAATDFVPAFNDRNYLLRRAIDRDDVRPALGAVYAAARRTFDSTPRALDDLGRNRDLPWADFNEITGPASPALGLLRVAHEVESIDATTGVTAIQLLNRAVTHRLELTKLGNKVNQSYLPALLARARLAGFEMHEAVTLVGMFNADKHLTRESGRAERESIGDGWPALAEDLKEASADAFVLGRLDESVALATLAGEVRTYIPNAHQLRSVVHAGRRIVRWPFVNALRHGTEFAFLQKLRHLPGAAAVAEYVRRDLLPRGAVMDRLTPILFTLVTERPGMIRDETDARAVIENEFFWPERPVPRENIFRDLPAALRAAWREHKPIDEPLAKALYEQKEKNPRAWRYETSHSQKLHHLLVQRLRDLDVMPRDLAGLKQLWLALTDRGTTAETDRLMHEMIALANADQVSDLRDLATREGRVWEADLHSRMSLTQAKVSQPYLRLLASTPGDRKRTYLIDEIVGDLKRTMPERGLAFAQFLEDLTVQINSSYDEAKRLSEAKGDVASRSVGDDNLRSVRTVFRDVARWPREDQFNFVKFLRGEAPAAPRLQDAFPRVGLERIQRMYEILPLAARVGLFDTFFTHGLVGEGPEAVRWVNKLSRHIVGGDKTEAQRVTLQVLTAFLYAVREVGNAQMTTTILSYLYALPSSAVASPVEVLKLVLEIFGATGIKVGQFTYASQILGEAGETLRSLQSRARVPDRIEIYEDVYDMLGVPVGTPLPFLVLELLGAASMKYAFMGQDRATLAKLVIKVFRLDAMNNVDLQFDVLEHMSEYLIRNYGPRYGVFKIIIKSARLAVKREGSMRNEIRRSRIARARIYDGRSTDQIKVEVPREDLVNARMIIAQYAAGVPFDDLPPEAKPLFARTLLEMENDIYFADRPVIRFDPDRHAGNAQMLFRVDDDGEVTMGPRHALGPIDFGQLLRMTRVQRERITKLFALAQIAGKVSVNDWVSNEIADLLDLGLDQRVALRRCLRAFVTSAGPRPVTLYVSVLAALEASGYEIRDTTYIDFVRGIIQLTPFERFAPDAPAPSRSFEAAVLREVKAYAVRHEFEPRERQAIDAINRWRRLRHQFTRGGLELLPTDLAQVNFDELIHRQKEVECQDALASSE